MLEQFLLYRHETVKRRFEYDLRKLREGVVEVETAGMLPEADVAFLCLPDAAAREAAAMVRNAERSLDRASAKPVEYLEWPDFQELLAAPPPALSP